MDIVSKFWAGLLRAILIVLDDNGELSNELKVFIMFLCKKIETESIAYREFVPEFNKVVSRVPQFMSTMDKACAQLAIGNLPQVFAYLYSSKDLRSLFKDLVKYKKAFFYSFSSLSFMERDKNSLLKIDVSSTFNEKYIGVTFLCFLRHFIRGISGHSFDFIAVNGSEKYLVSKSMAPLIYEKDGALFASVENQWLDKHLFMYDPILQSELEVELNSYDPTASVPGSLVDKIMSTLEASERPAQLTSADIATIFNISQSTLRRRLNEEKASYKQLHKEFLFNKVIYELVHSHKKLEVVAVEIGYSDRSALERAFKAYMGGTPVQLRSLGKRLQQSTFDRTLKDIINELPPLPESCQNILMLNAEELTLDAVVAIVEEDPIFTARLMGMANRASFGKKVASLKEAIGSRLGVETVKNLAVVFSAKDQLSTHISGIDTLSLTRGIVTSFEVYKKLISKNKLTHLLNKSLDGQLVLFSLLGFFILFHKDFKHADAAKQQFAESDSYIAFKQHLKQHLELDIIDASMALIVSWGLSSAVIKEMNRLLSLPGKRDESGQLKSLCIEIAQSLSLGLVFEHWRDSNALSEFADSAELSLEIEDITAVEFA